MIKKTKSPDPLSAATDFERRFLAGDVNLDAVRRCAGLDHSDTDNGRRLREHFGNNLTVIAQAGIPGGDFLSWDSRHWDLEGGANGAALLAQKIGELIAHEAEFLEHTPTERAAIEAAAARENDNSAVGKALREDARRAHQALEGRRAARRRFATTSKNSARLRNMRDCAAPHLRRSADDFNCDPMLVVTQTDTLRMAIGNDGGQRRARVDVIEGHRREDYATGLIPCDYDPSARAPKFEAFLDECLPDLDVRRTVQGYSGTGLLGVLPQRLMFHHGFGANGKSVFLAVLSGVIGKSYGVSLPKETLLGLGERGAGQASPDLVRLYGKRFVRIDELKENEQVREDLVKRLTGGDEMAVRNLFKGYFEFANHATPHMSGNGKPKIDGTDNGIWRRMLVVHWDVTIPPERRREFDAFVADLLTERSGILNWLLEGARDYLENGLFIAEKVAAVTQDYREEMDPIGRFAQDCVRRRDGYRIKARVLYEAYKSWAAANAVTACFETRFAREMEKKFEKDRRGRVRAYLDVELHSVPDRPESQK